MGTEKDSSLVHLTAEERKTARALAKQHGLETDYVRRAVQGRKLRRAMAALVVGRKDATAKRVGRALDGTGPPEETLPALPGILAGPHGAAEIAFIAPLNEIMNVLIDFAFKLERNGLLMLDDGTRFEAAVECENQIYTNANTPWRPLRSRVA